MTFANPLPWWALVGVAAAAAALSLYAYRAVPLAPRRRGALAALRFITLATIVVLLMRPVARTTQADVRDAVVPVLVDMSRSMGLEDTGERRIDRARRLVAERMLPVFGSRFRVEVLGFGERLSSVAPADLAATARRSDLSGALSAVRDRYRGRAVAGIVLLSDGGDTSGTAETVAGEGPPVYAIGIGSSAPVRDREVLSVTAAEAVLDDSRVDLAVSAVSHGWGTQAIEMRLLENGRPIEVRRVTPGGDGTPVHEVFHVSPGRGAPTVYTLEIPPAAGELAPENNARSVLVQPPSRSRRVLLVEGAPGFEHSFLKRAWSADPGLEIDSVVRKGRNEQGAETFYIQAARSRSDRLRTGYPQRAQDLFVYDALVLANVEAHHLTRAQLDATREFVTKRGGGLLVLGARSFLPQGLTETSLEEVLPLDLSERGGGVLPAASVRGTNRVMLTASGERHPIMQLGADTAATRERWEAVPALASVAPLGGPRPGASVLAIASGPGGAPRALVAVQRYGDGRSMLFAGEASWRWRMLMPATDRAYDTFWRQSVRWLALTATDPVAVSIPGGGPPGDDLPLRVAVRDASFDPQRDASVDLRVMSPDGRLQQLRAAPEPDRSGGGWYVARFRADQAGVYRVTAEARQGTTALGSSSASLLVGGADPEMTDPRLNLRLLQRVTRASGGRLLAENEIPALSESLAAAAPLAALGARRDLWHNGWSFALLLMLLASEWVVRRRWGLR